MIIQQHAHTHIMGPHTLNGMMTVRHELMFTHVRTRASSKDTGARDRGICVRVRL